jgi:hypothetical protein
MIVIAAPTYPGAFATLTHDAAQATTNPLIQAGERPFVTRFEILKPSSEQIIQTNDDDLHTMTMTSFGLVTNGVFELIQALPPRPALQSSGASSPFKVITEKIKPISRFLEVGDACLLGMQGQTSFPQQLCQPGQRCFRPFQAAAQDDQIIRIPDHLPSLFGHDYIHRVQVEVGQQGTDNRPLGRSLFRPPFLKPSRISCCKYFSSSAKTRPSAIYFSTSCISRSWGIISKYVLRSASTTHN